jgi:hypothetical protein
MKPFTVPQQVFLDLTEPALAAGGEIYSLCRRPRRVSSLFRRRVSSALRIACRAADGRPDK